MKKNIEKLINILSENNKKEDVVNYYNNQCQKYIKLGNSLAKKDALNDTLMKFSIPGVRTSIDALSELLTENKELSPIDYFNEKCLEYVETDEASNVLPHALIDTYVEYVKYGRKK